MRIGESLLGAADGGASDAESVEPPQLRAGRDVRVGSVPEARQGLLPGQSGNYIGFNKS
jgi:hypothetical protein